MKKIILEMSFLALSLLTAIASLLGLILLPAPGEYLIITLIMGLGWTATCLVLIRDSSLKIIRSKMKHRRDKKCIELFISKIKEKYPKLYITYDYNEKDDEFEIWHNSHQLQFGTSGFVSFAGSLMVSILEDRDIYNYSFGYDYFKCTDPY